MGEHDDKLLMSETIAGQTSEETIGLLLDNLRDQVLDRCKRAGYVVDPADVRGIVRGQPGPAARRVEVWVKYRQHTAEHRRALANAYDDGLASSRTFRETVTEERVPTDEQGDPLTGHAWAAYVAALTECPYLIEPVDGQYDREAEVLAVAWQRGWDEYLAAIEDERVPHSAPYLRTVRP